MSPTPEVSERQRNAAYKAWETIRRKKAEQAKDAGQVKTRPPATSPSISIRIRLRKKWNAADYPANWKKIGEEIRNRSRNANSQEQCECLGECGRHNTRCEEINGTWAMHRRSKGKVTIRLTIAHLCHTKKCDDRLHLRAMCEPCHLIFDLRCRQRGLCGEDAVRWALQQGSRLSD